MGFSLKHPRDLFLPFCRRFAPHQSFAARHTRPPPALTECGGRGQRRHRFERHPSTTNAHHSNTKGKGSVRKLITPIHTDYQMHPLSTSCASALYPSSCAMIPQTDGLNGQALPFSSTRSQRTRHHPTPHTFPPCQKSVSIFAHQRIQFASPRPSHCDKKLPSKEFPTFLVGNFKLFR
jgi:hypothetical protein